MKLRMQGSPELMEESNSLSEASNSLTVSPPLAANNDINGSKKFFAAITENADGMKMDLNWKSCIQNCIRDYPLTFLFF